MIGKRGIHVNHADKNDAMRRKEFGAFLRSRRERLTPANIGLPNGSRRRTPGLRREEVSMLAGVGTTWYTWLEQGRDVRASVEVLNALADALRLDIIEKHHLFMLHGTTVPMPADRPLEQVSESLRRMLASLNTQPAYVLGWRWDILAWNRAATSIFGDYELLKGDERNIMHMLFANPGHRQLLVDWEQVARASLALFRADTARYAGNADLDRLVATLTRQSRAFRTWWPKHEISQQLTGYKRIEYPSKGRMLFEHITLALADASDMKLVVYTPLRHDKPKDAARVGLRLTQQGERDITVLDGVDNLGLHDEAPFERLRK
jgi:transcriptional regulator with XRE-family HTH domain